jgi:hypothetical protein
VRDQWEEQKGLYNNRSCRKHSGGIKEEAAVKKSYNVFQ